MSARWRDPRDGDIERYLADWRGMNSQLPLSELVRQSIYSRLAGYEDI